MMEYWVWGFVGLPVLAHWGRRVWLLDLFNHFRMQIGIFEAGLAVWLFTAGRPIEGIFALLSAGFCADTVWRRARGKTAVKAATAPADHGPAGDQSFSILTCNVFMFNRGHEALDALILQKDPDIVVLLETDHRWFGAMRQALSRYQHHKAEPRDDFFGLAVFSKFHMEAVSARLHDKGKHSMRCLIRHSSGDFVLWCLHPEPPFLPYSAKRQRGEFEELKRRLASESMPAIVTGDLNAAPWSHPFAESLAHLTDCARGRGLATTWPSTLPAVLRIPIDHMLHTGEFETVSYEVLPYVGSDHRPVYARFARPASKKGI